MYLMSMQKIFQTPMKKLRKKMKGGMCEWHIFLDITSLVNILEPHHKGHRVSGDSSFFPPIALDPKHSLNLWVRGGDLCYARSYLSLNFLLPTSSVLLQGILTTPITFFPPLAPFLLLWFLLVFLDRDVFQPKTVYSLSFSRMQRKLFIDCAWG